MLWKIVKFFKWQNIIRSIKDQHATVLYIIYIYILKRTYHFPKLNLYKSCLIC